MALAGHGAGGSPDAVVVRMSVMVPGGQNQIARSNQTGELGLQPGFFDVAVVVTQPEGGDRG